MKGKNLRTLIFEGNSYTFDTEAFCKAITRKTSDKSEKPHKKIYITKVLEEISDKAGKSYDAVRKWKSGESGPSDIETVQIIAEILNVQCSSLLIPLVSDKKEKEHMSEYERNLIADVYKQVFSIIVNPDPFIIPEGEDPSDMVNDFFSYRRNLAKKLEPIHSMISSEKLKISENVANKLHTLLLDIYELIRQDMPITAWEVDSIHNAEYVEAIYFKYYIYDSREDLLLSNEPFAEEYLIDEMNYLLDLGRSKDSEAVKEFLEKYPSMSAEEITQTRIYEGDIAVTPKLVYEHNLAGYLKCGFVAAFPELEN